MARAMKTDMNDERLVNREFEKHGPGKILLTDITYLKRSIGCFTHLSTIKDVFTKQILSYCVSYSLQRNCMLHSTQGSYYISIPFKNLFKLKGTESRNAWIQSISRRGDC